MELPPLTTGDEESSTPFEWSDLFDFTIDDQLLFNLDQNNHQQPEDLQGSSDRVRKRDPRMICENFLAGRIPCACPELDAKTMEEEEEAGPGKKRPRMSRVAKCQVPGCEADISQLKGYHRRHRVCLVCANATSVVLDGDTKRYCQQCGKFHVLSDFDEGKRSCRRKLERHNNRRRRKSADPRGGGGGGGAIEKDSQQAEDILSDGETGKGIFSSPGFTRGCCTYGVQMNTCNYKDYLVITTSTNLVMTS